MKSKRFFAFGCSFTNYFYPTWADFVGYNFDEFYNFGNPGLSNKTIGERLVEVDSNFAFNENDTVIISLSGLGRYNFLVETPDSKTAIWGGGDLEKDASDAYILGNKKLRYYYDIIKFMRDKFWKRKWGIYHTWLTVKTAKRILVSNQVNHKIFCGLDMQFYRDKELLGLDNQEVNMVEEIYNMLDIKESLQEFNDTQPANRFGDSHPFIDAHYKFVEKYMPEFTSAQILNLYTEMFTESLQYNEQSAAYKALGKYKKHKDCNILYGEYT